MVTFHCSRCPYKVSVKDRTTGLNRLRKHYWKKHKPYMVKAIQKGKKAKEAKMLDQTFTLREATEHSARAIKTAHNWPKMTRDDKIAAVSRQVAQLVIDYLD